MTLAEDLRGVRQTAVWTVLCIVLLTASATAGLNVWPGDNLLPLQSASFGSLYVAWEGYAVVVAVLFWGSMPRPRAQACVIVAWLPVTALLWWLLRDSFTIGWFGDTNIPAEMVLASGLALPSLVALLWRTLGPLPPGVDGAIEVELRWVLLFVLFGMFVPRAALNLTVSCTLRLSTSSHSSSMRPQGWA